ncbi:hypothetical protein M422DRAFT_240630 [Sphaerobolus stellatus SS14]|nr:hypothetical protein M422DRAFT_240630 [Sphaerobolus stellatus SS14]
MTSTYSMQASNADELPSHHLHSDSELLPAQTAADAALNDFDALPTPPTAHRPHPLSTASTTATLDGEQAAGDPNFNKDTDVPRPLDTKHVPGAGGVVREAHEKPHADHSHKEHADHSHEGKVGIVDKIIGATEKLTGKLTNDPELQEKGELRGASGKAAELGQERLPHA